MCQSNGDNAPPQRVAEQVSTGAVRVDSAPLCEHDEVRTSREASALFCRCLLATSLTAVDDCLCPA